MPTFCSKKWNFNGERELQNFASIYLVCRVIDNANFSGGEDLKGNDI